MGGGYNDTSAAKVDVETTLACGVSNFSNAVNASLTTSVLDGATTLASVTSQIQPLCGDDSTLVKQSLQLERVDLWSAERPALYTVESTLSSATGTDKVETRIGVRRFDFDPRD